MSANMRAVDLFVPEPLYLTHFYQTLFWRVLLLEIHVTQNRTVAPWTMQFLYWIHVLKDVQKNKRGLYKQYDSDYISMVTAFILVYYNSGLI